MAEARNKLVWVDLEMTGLDPESCVVLEIATVVTSSDLEEVIEGPAITIHQPESVLLGMNDVVKEMHRRSGLWERVLASEVTLEEAERQTLEFVRGHVEKGQSPLCGNSVWKDKQFIEKYMPGLMGHMHYRIVDVSTIKELVRRWYPAEMQAPKKREVHRAMDDIRESIEELRWYRSKVMVPVG
ncbi:MAG: oligoribonuclease [Polyangiaceae bacterium]